MAGLKSTQSIPAKWHYLWSCTVCFSTH